MDIKVHCYTVWNSEQVKDILDSEYLRQRNLVKVEITKGFEPGKEVWHVIVWCYPELGLEGNTN